MCSHLQAAPPISYAGGDGSTMEKAVVIKGGDEMSGVQAEDVYLDRHFPGNKQTAQGLYNEKNRSYDRIDFTTSKGEKKSIFFDITAFFGKVK